MALGAVPGVRGSHKSDNSQSNAGSADEGSLNYSNRAAVQRHAVRDARDRPVFPCSTFETAPGAVAVEAVVQPGAPEASAGAPLGMSAKRGAQKAHP